MVKYQGLLTTLEVLTHVLTYSTKQSLSREANHPLAT